MIATIAVITAIAEKKNFSDRHEHKETTFHWRVAIAATTSAEI